MLQRVEPASWEKADNDFAKLPEDIKGHLQDSFTSLSISSRSNSLALFFSIIPHPQLHSHAPLGPGFTPSCPVASSWWCFPSVLTSLFCFRFLLYSSVHWVLIELKSENTWTNCKLPESLTRTAQGCLFFWVIFPFVWFCFVFKSFSCCDNS